MKGDKLTIIGGGIIGLCAAWYAKQVGCDVQVIEKSDMQDGTSFGNAGMIVPSHFVPMASPGVIAQGLKWMLNSKSPFYIKPRLNLDLIQWLWHFYHSANVSKVDGSMPILYVLNERSKWLYKEMVSGHGFDISFEEKGLLMLYKTRKQAEKEKELAEKAHKLGLEAQLFDPKGLQDLEPGMDLDVLGGIYFPGDAHLYPNKLMQQLATRLREQGVSFLPHTSIVDFKTSGSTVESLITDDQQEIPIKNVLITSGIWTSFLLKRLGIKMHLQDGKGYSFTLQKPKLRPHIPTILSEAKVAITPMGDDLRIGGTLELSGLSPKINPKRVQGIIESIPKYYRNLDVPIHRMTNIWKGYRPCTPDGMPYIGRSEKWSNLYVGTGHGMMGLSLGAITGKLLSEIIIGEEPMISTRPFRLNRF